MPERLLLHVVILLRKTVLPKWIICGNIIFYKNHKIKKCKFDNEIKWNSFISECSYFIKKNIVLKYNI